MMRQSFLFYSIKSTASSFCTSALTLPAKQETVLKQFCGAPHFPTVIFALIASDSYIVPPTNQIRFATTSTSAIYIYPTAPAQMPDNILRSGTCWTKQQPSN